MGKTNLLHSQFLFLELVSVSTGLCFIALLLALFFLIPNSHRGSNVVFVLSGFSFILSILYAIAGWFLNRSFRNCTLTVRVIGVINGGFAGLLIGGLLGSDIAYALGIPEGFPVILGAVVFWPGGRWWLGPAISKAIARKFGNEMVMKDEFEIPSMRGYKTRDTNSNTSSKESQ